MLSLFETPFIDMLMTLHFLLLLSFITLFVIFFLLFFCRAGLGLQSGEDVLSARITYYSLITDLYIRDVCMTVSELFLYLLLTIS